MTQQVFVLGRTESASRVTALCDAAGAQVDWIFCDDVVDEHGRLTDDCVQGIRRFGTVLNPGIDLSPFKPQRPFALQLRQRLHLYAGIRPIKTFKGAPSRYDHIDLTVIRENSEGVYSGLEHHVHPGVVESIKVVTVEASRRIADFACRFALKNGYKRLAFVHKANIMKRTDGAFLRACEEVAEAYPQLATRGMIVDNTCMQLVQKPGQFDVLVCGNLYGDIISDLGAGLIGGSEYAWGVDRNDDIAVFHAVRHFDELAAPTVSQSLLSATIGLLDDVGQSEVAERLKSAWQHTLESSTARSTHALFERIARKLEAPPIT